MFLSFYNLVRVIAVVEFKLGKYFPRLFDGKISSLEVSSPVV
jgi:hypothetical protein